MKGIGKLFGFGGQGMTKEQKAAQQAQFAAQRAAQEESARIKAESEASGHRLRGLGRRALAFQGVEGGLAANLAG